MAKRFRVALSFAGHKRPFVAEVARILAGRLGGQEQILYDRFHEAEFANPDLALNLPELYRSQADLVVAVLCKDYEQKEWCGLEWRAVFALIKERADQSVMLCRYDLVEGVGLLGLAGYIDLDDRTAAETATLILERLALNERLPRHHYAVDAPAGPDWPEVAPPLDWPVADHTDARRAFAQLITRVSPFRVLPIHGSSETGKSLLTKQFEGNALKIPDLTCGRFDFKGSSEIDSELRRFAERLGVADPTPGTGVSAQLGQIFGAVRKSAAPTLLVFDTFELATGEAERWVKENLLLATIRAPWLRVIVVGQKTTSPYGEPWAAFACPPIELRSPTPEDWFDYGRAHHTEPAFTIGAVRTVHELVKGKSSVMMQVCGPPA